MPFHTDDPDRVVTLPDGRVIRNYTDEEYAATWADGDPHPGPPASVLAAAVPVPFVVMGGTPTNVRVTMDGE